MTKEEMQSTYNPKWSRFRTFWKQLRKNKAAVVGGLCIIAFLFISLLGTSWIGPHVFTYAPNEVDIPNKFQPPSSEHWFGTDNYGRDIFTRIVYGMKLTLFIGFSSVAIGGVIGVTLGVVAGYFGRWIDTLIMRVMDVLLAFPGILLALAIVSVLGGSIQNMIIAVSIYSIPAFARVVRGSTLSVRQLEYIDAMHALGASHTRIIVKHILPNVLSPIIVQATMRIASAVLTASGLSFLGLGVKPPTPEWGAMMDEGRNFMREAPHIILFPGLMIVLVVLAFNIFGDGLRDALDPKMKR